MLSGASVFVQSWSERESSIHGKREKPQAIACVRLCEWIQFEERTTAFAFRWRTQIPATMHSYRIHRRRRCVRIYLQFVRSEFGLVCTFKWPTQHARTQFPNTHTPHTHTHDYLFTSHAGALFSFASPEVQLHVQHAVLAHMCDRHRLFMNSNHDDALRTQLRFQKSHCFALRIEAFRIHPWW